MLLALLLITTMSACFTPPNAELSTAAPTTTLPPMTPSGQPERLEVTWGEMRNLTVKGCPGRKYGPVCEQQSRELQQAIELVDVATTYCGCLLNSQIAEVRRVTMTVTTLDPTTPKDQESLADMAERAHTALVNNPIPGR